MNEKLLQFIWKNALYNKAHLCDTLGQPIKVQHPGYQNTDAGPDFLNAKIMIGSTLWAGTVEIHINGNEWFAHNHHHDVAYNNVILHVCLTQAEVAITQDNNKIHALNLGSRIDSKLLEKYEFMMAAHQNIPCQNLLSETTALDWIQNHDKLLAERLEFKMEAILEDLDKNKGDWDTLLYHYLAAALGQKVNAEPMKILSNQLSFRLIQQHIEQPIKIEALLFGSAGLLSPHFKEAYPKQLLKEYRFLAYKYGLTPLDPSIWKFMRLRPAAFPTIRIAQMAALLNNKRGLLRIILEEEKLENILHHLSTTPAEYWRNHFKFDTEVKSKSAVLGSHTRNSICINAIIPILFSYGKIRNMQGHCDKALKWLEQIPAENNKTIRLFNFSSVPIENAQHSQAILQLYNNYCTFKRCLNCGIGNKLLAKL